MRPGHIRVFDGLRITTEHMEHLQGALHSAVEDVREILGLGRVFSGFEVVATGDHSITVQPGLAFDFQRHRLACDEPKTVAVTFAPEEDVQYVCVQYDQIEEGQVEDHFTLIWDSCAVVLRPTLPRPAENLVPIAQLTKQADGALAILSLIRPEQHEAGAGVLPADSAEHAAGTTAPVLEAEGIPASLPGGSSAPGPWRLQVRQGLVRLASVPERGDSLPTLIAEPLRRQLGNANGTPGGAVRVTLAEQEVALSFPVSSLTCHTILSATLGMDEAGMPTPGPPPGGESPSAHKLSCQAIAQGEATLTPEEVAQYGLVTLHFSPSAGADGAPRWPAELTEDGITHLSLQVFGPGADNASAARDILSHLSLLVRVDILTPGGFKLICHLLWRGDVTEAIVQQLETHTMRFTWEVRVAWKALGESPNKEER